MNLDRLVKEIERRNALNQLISLTIDSVFIITPLDLKPRMRRNEAHSVVLKALSISGLYNSRLRRLIKECLISKGVKPTILDGRKYFKGIALKSNS